MAIVTNVTAKILIQIGDQEPKEIGTIEIPIELSTGSKPSGPTYRKLSDNPQA